MPRTVVLTLHLEHLDEGGHSWWVDSASEPGFYAAGETFAEAVGLATEALREDYGDELLIRLQAGEHGTAIGFATQNSSALRVPQPA